MQAQVASAQALVKATKARLDALANGGVQAQRAQLQAAHDQAQSQLTAAQDNLNVAQARLTPPRTARSTRSARRLRRRSTPRAKSSRPIRRGWTRSVPAPQDEEVQAAQDADHPGQQQLAIATQPATAQDIEAQRALVEQAQPASCRRRSSRTPEFDIEQQQHVVAQAAGAARRAPATRTRPGRAGRSGWRRPGPGRARAGAAGRTRDADHGARRRHRLRSPGSPGALVGADLADRGADSAVARSRRQCRRERSSAACRRVRGVSAGARLSETKRLRGTVAAIAPAVDQKTRTASVRIQPKDDAGRLRPGMLAKVSIVTASQIKRAAGAAGGGARHADAQRGGNGRDPGWRGSRSALEIELGLVNASAVQVRSGLTDGQVVAVGNVNGLNSGDVVVPQVRTAVASTIGAQQ